MSPTGPLPSLSQIMAWHTEHLDNAAMHWQRIADTWDSAFTAIYRQAPNPGGARWTGAAADAAVLRAGRDRVQVLGAVDSLHSAARVAAAGADEIQGAKRLALGAVDDARAAGFTVGETLTVSGQVSGSSARVAARQAHAQVLAARIGSLARALVAVDSKVADQVAAAIAGVNSVRFDALSVADGGADRATTQIQAVDYQTQAELTPPAPQGPDLIYCHAGDTPDFWWCEGFNDVDGPYTFGSPFDLSGVA